MDHKALVAWRGFALGAGQRVLFFGDGVQKDGEVFANGQKAIGHHLFWRRPHHHPVAVNDGQPEQSVANRPADQVDLHPASVGAGLFGQAWCSGQPQCHGVAVG